MKLIRTIRSTGVQHAWMLTRSGQQRHRAFGFKSRAAQTVHTTRWRTMITLTLDPSKISGLVLGDDHLYRYKNDTAGQYLHRYIMGVWRKFRARCWAGLVDKKGRHRNFPFKYMLVVEWTKKGLPHLHVLVDRFIPRSFATRAWVECGGGRVNKFSYLGNHAHSQRAVLYTLKYITKSMDISLRGCRRWSVSNGILPPKESREKDDQVYDCVGLKEVAMKNFHYPTVIVGEIDDDGKVEEREFPICELLDELGIPWSDSYEPPNQGTEE